MAGKKPPPRITDAVVLAAGYGERLRPITLDVPKPAVHFLNRPVICHILDRLAEYGVKRVFINTHHLPEKIVEAASPPRDRMEIVFSHEPEILGTAGLFFDLKERLSGPFFALNGDIFLDPPLCNLEERLLGGEDEAVLLLRRRRQEDDYTSLRLEADGRLSGIGEGEHFFCGVYAARPSFIELVRERKKENLVPLLLRPAISAGKVGGKIHEGHWNDLGSPKAFLDATREVLENMRDGGAKPTRGSRLVISSGCTALVEKSAVLGDDVKLAGFAVIGGGCVIGKGAYIENSVILPGTFLADGIKVRDSIVLGDKAVKV